MLIREATAADVPGMAQIRTAAAWTGGAGADVMARYLAGAHHPQQALAPRVMFVAEEGGELLGFVAGHQTRRFGCTGELQWLLVSPAWRGTGVADRLLDRMATWFARHAATSVCVNVDPSNAYARRLYVRHGAVDLSEHWMVWHHFGPQRPPAAFGTPAG